MNTEYIILATIMSLVIIISSIYIGYYKYLKVLNKQESKVREYEMTIDFVLIKKQDLIHNMLYEKCPSSSIDLNKYQLNYSFENKKEYAKKLEDIICEISQMYKEEITSKIKESISEIECLLDNAKRQYNIEVSNYNYKLRKFPTSMIGKHKKYLRKDFFEFD